MQNRIHYLRWTAGLIVVTNSFLTGTKNDKYGNAITITKPNKVPRGIIIHRIYGLDNSSHGAFG